MADIGAIASGSTAMAQAHAAQDAQVNLQRRAMDIAESHAQQLIEALPETGSGDAAAAGVEPHLGNRIDVHA